MKRYIRSTHYIVYAKGKWNNTSQSGLFYRRSGSAEYSMPNDADRFSKDEADKICSQHGRYTWVKYPVK